MNGHKLEPWIKNRKHTTAFFTQILYPETFQKFASTRDRVLKPKTQRKRKANEPHRTERQWNIVVSQNQYSRARA